MFHHFLFVSIELQLLRDQRISLDDLGRRETRRKSGPFRMVLNEVLDRVQTAVHRPAVIFLAAEIQPCRLLLITRNMDRVTYEFLDACVFCG